MVQSSRAAPESVKTIPSISFPQGKLGNMGTENIVFIQVLSLFLPKS